jgi:hypothetical protein
MKHLKVEGHSNLVRDEETKAILNTSMKDYNQYMRLKKIKENENKRFEDLENDLNGIKDDLQDIKNLLGELLNGSR